MKWLLMCFLLVGCAETWMVRQDQAGGVIGYKNYDSQAAAKRDVEKLIHCKDYTFVSDQLYVEDPLRVSAENYLNSQSAKGTVFENYKRAPDAIHYYTYQCNSPETRAVSSMDMKNYDCAIKCGDMFKAGKLGKGVTAETCIKEICN